MSALRARGALGHMAGRPPCARGVQVTGGRSNSRHAPLPWRRGGVILSRMSATGDPPSDPGRGPASEEGRTGRSPAWFEGLAGRLLIAMPGIGDPRFERAVILMCVHSPEQAMGVAVNRPLDGITLRGVMDKLGVGGAQGAPDQQVLSGGPVERERGFVLHTDDYETLDSTLPIAAGISMTATREVLEALADADRRPHRSRLVLGCASWAPGGECLADRGGGAGHRLRRRPRHQVEPRAGPAGHFGGPPVGGGGTCLNAARLLKTGRFVSRLKGLGRFCRDWTCSPRNDPAGVAEPPCRGTILSSRALLAPVEVP